MNRRLFIMVKEPRPGRVKTRLGKSIGHVNAAWWFRHQTKRLINRLSKDPRWETILCVSPDTEGLASRVWPRNVPRRQQGGGDLGDRMARILRSCDDGPALIIGADIPDIQSGDIATAFARLGNHDAVIGPAPDGGFWLIGAKHGTKLPRSLFQNVRWSTQHAMAETVASMPDLSVGYLRELRDVDTVDDLV